MDLEMDTTAKISAENANDSPKIKKKKFIHPKKTAEERKLEKDKQKLRKSRIILRNLSFKCKDIDLQKEFEKFGTIKECNILKRADGKLVGCAFIQYEKVNQAAKAIHHANGKEFFGRPVIIDWAVNRKKFLQHLREQKKTANVQMKTEKCDNMKIKEEENVSEADDASDSDGDGNGESDDSSKDVGNDSSRDSDDGDTDENEDDDGESNDDQNSVKDEKKPIHKKSNDVAEGCTVFIKNIPFESTNSDLYKVCRQFGPIYYAVITVDKISGHSKGNGFVKFKTKESADMCSKAGTTFKLLDQILDPQPALSRNEIQQKKDTTKKQPSDSRNLYLAKEGQILAGTPAAEGLSASDLAKRLRLEHSKTQSLKNLNRFVSMERLTIHNIPPNYDDIKLRKVIMKACALKPKECRIMLENRPSLGYPLGKSKGYGFLSFKNHDEALNCLRKVNNCPKVFGKNNRPIVSFSIEDRTVHNIKMKRLLKSQQKNPLFKQKATNGDKTTIDVKPNVKALKKRKNKPLSSTTKTTMITTSTEAHETKENENITATTDLSNFAGATAEKGSKYKTRPQWKLREDNAVHSKSVKQQKKQKRKLKQLQEIRQEKRQIERPKQGKRQLNDADSSLVNKYLKRLHAQDDLQPKSKRSKWYVE